MRNVIINDILIAALNRLYYNDYANINYGVSERNICARLAHHMENIMRKYDKDNKSSFFKKYFADVEYNRMGDGEKKYFENSLKRPQYMVSDLLIQSRGYERNLLAVEAKRKDTSSEVAKDNDRYRLRSLVSSEKNDTDNRCVHNTLVGAFIIYSAKDVTIELYENVNGEGVFTDNLYFVYSADEKKLQLQPNML